MSLKYEPSSKLLHISAKQLSRFTPRERELPPTMHTPASTVDMQGNVIDDVKPTYAVQVHLFFFFTTLEPRVE